MTALPAGFVTSLKWDSELDVYACTVRYQLTMANGLSLLLVGTMYGPTRLTALALSFEMVARQLFAMHSTERRR